MLHDYGCVGELLLELVCWPGAIKQACVGRVVFLAVRLRLRRFQRAQHSSSDLCLISVAFLLDVLIHGRAEWMVCAFAREVYM